MLENKTIVVTGANGTLGRAVVEKARSLGAEVVQLDIAFSEDIKGETHIVNLMEAESTRACFEKIGRFDGLFNLAGGFTIGETAWQESDDPWEAMQNINVKTLRNALKAAVPALVEQGNGAIVNVGAYGALSGQGQMSAYTASKSVVMRLTESLSEEVKAKGINVNAVLPTVIDTPPNRQAMPDVDPRQWVSPAELANVICFLGSDMASAVHGALVPVRGLS